MAVRALAVVALLFVTGCSAASSVLPTSPSAPGAAALLSDPGFSLAFYREFALGGGQRTLWRPRSAKVFIRTHAADERRTAIDQRTLDHTAQWAREALEGFGYPADVRFMSEGFAEDAITLIWNSMSVFASSTVETCADVVKHKYSAWITVDPARCQDIAATVIRHEIGHALGFYHSSDKADLMYYNGTGRPSVVASEKERLHARIANTQAIGSSDPQ